MVEGGGEVVGDDDALARSEAVVLDDEGRAELLAGRLDLVDRVADVRHRGGHAGLGHHLLREGLAALELRRLGARAEGGEAGLAQAAGHPGDERTLGADHHEVDVELLRQRDGGVEVAEVERARVGVPCDAGVPGGGVELLHVRVGGQRSDEGMLPSTGAEHEHLHAREPTDAPAAHRQRRPGRE